MIRKSNLSTYVFRTHAKQIKFEILYEKKQY